MTFASVDLPAPDGPITAVSVPGRAENDTLFSSVRACSIVRLMPRNLQTACASGGFGFGATNQGAVVEYQVDVADRHHVALAAAAPYRPGCR